MVPLDPTRTRQFNNRTRPVPDYDNRQLTEGYFNSKKSVIFAKNHEKKPIKFVSQKKFLKKDRNFFFLMEIFKIKNVEEKNCGIKM